MHFFAIQNFAGSTETFARCNDSISISAELKEHQQITNKQNTRLNGKQTLLLHTSEINKRFPVLIKKYCRTSDPV